MSTREDWLVVLRPDAVVDAVGGGAPVTWVGRVMFDNMEVPAPLQDAAVRLLGSSAHVGCLRRDRIEIEGVNGVQSVELVVVDALPLHFTHVRIHELTMQTLDVFAAQARSCDVDLTVTHGKEVPTAIVCDGQKIAWVLATTVGNALRYAQRVAERRAPHVKVHIDWNAREPELVMKISDNGPGMPSQRAKWLFERDPSTGQAAGLALVMVRDVVAAHRGRIEVASKVDEGTAITLHLPAIRMGSALA